ncbi:hypothetical protein NPIL_513011 [Nephila pilipes]|uniref:Uncharacterized protein n=1 Tax=Nephila pilipes TaxID=299642 RepID=A0A8X6QBL5_NEPPI|nr:hypothetical protein NPIL_513011 [Nephila pilipes]
MSRYLRQRDNLLKGTGALDRTLPLSSPEPATPHRGQPVPSPVKRPARHQCALGVFLDAPVGAHATLAVAERYVLPLTKCSGYL